MTAVRKQQMELPEFLIWAEQQPERWELIDGEPVAMAPERVLHGDTKFRAARALGAAIAAANVRCRFVLDSAAVSIDDHTSYQPDAMVYCGEPVSGYALIVPHPVIVVEVLSPSNAITDLRDKLRGYFRVQSIHHYLIVDPDKRLVIHHRRGDAEVLETRISSEGEITLDPPGLRLSVSDLFEG